jgi:sensor c-di-GMP phosphodiesterase-like protein
LNNEGYIDRLHQLLVKYEIPKGIIQLELTETMFSEMMNVKETLTKIKDIGFGTVIDDFGSGYSSLSILGELPVDTLKIDKRFFQESTDSIRIQKIIEKIVEMAGALQLKLICEGVETIEQAEYLIGIGCRFAQGFLYSKPIPQQDFLELIRNSKIQSDKD